MKRERIKMSATGASRGEGRREGRKETGGKKQAIVKATITL